MRELRRGTCLGALLLLTACANQYAYRVAPTGGARVRTVRAPVHFFFWGLGEARSVELERMCDRARIFEFGSYMSAINWLGVVVTLGVYSPRTAYAVCQASDA